MKALYKYALTLLLVVSLFQFTHAQEEGDYDAIRTTINYYIDGGTNHDTETLLKAFHTEARMRYVKDGEFKDVNAYDFFNRPSDPEKAPSNRIGYVESITVHGNAASANVRIDYDNFSYLDFMQLLKIDGEWKIVSKIFYGHKHVIKPEQEVKEE